MDAKKNSSGNERKTLVPPALPRSVGGFTRLGKRVLPMAGTAAAIGLSGCATAPRQPAVQSQQVQQQVESFASGLQGGPRTKIIKGGIGGGADNDPNRRAASPVAVAVESQSGMPRDLVPGSAMLKWAERPDSAVAADGAMSSEEAKNLAALVAQQSIGVVPQTLAAAAGPGRTASAGAALDALPLNVTKASAPVVEAAVITPEPTLEDALAVVRKHAASQGLNGALALALLDSAGRTEALQGLGKEDQQLAGDLLEALDQMGTASPGTDAAERAEPLVAAARKWEEKGDLRLPKLALASKVDSFGVYTDAGTKFQAGKNHAVIIYCEVGNFTTLADKDGYFVTKLTEQESLVASDGAIVLRPTIEDVEDRSLNQRKDFYLVKRLTLPDTLAAGKYLLKMRVTDQQSSRIKTTQLPIEITVN